MSQAKTLANRGHFYCTHVKPVLIDFNFVVDASNVNGLGIKLLKGQGIDNVFMNSTASFTGDTHSNTVVDGITDTSSLVVGMAVQGSGIPAGTTIATITSATAITLSAAATTTVGGGTITYQAVGSPKPGAGLIWVKLGDNYMRYYGKFESIVSPLSGSSVLVASAGVVRGTAYTITIVGTTTYAGWVSLGMPSGITPAVGVSFIAKTTGTAAGTGAVQASLVSGVNALEVIGDPNTTINPIPVGGSPNVGGWIAFQALGPSTSAVVSTLTMNSYTPAGTITNGTPDTFAGTPAVLTGTVGNTGGATTLVKTAPVDGSLIALSLYLGQSSVLIDGE